MRESVVQSLRTLALYLLIGLPILIIVTRVWMPERFQGIEFNQPWEKEPVQLDQSFTGNWKFSILDNPSWKEADFEDGTWEELDPSRPWERQGFEGYNGYAWYRKTININPELRGKQLALYLGQIDDVDEVFVNGKMVGKSGQFPPRFATAYNKERVYQLSPQQTEKGTLKVAIRVFDAELDGGLLGGNMGLKIEEDAPYFEIPLEGIWKFRTSFKNEQISAENTGKWSEIYVPSTWEEQGFYEYDGYAIYQKEFDLSQEQLSQSWILVLGKVDDIDRTYINGELIGSTGDWNGNLTGDEWLTDRAYPIPAQVLKSGPNVLTVKVYDGLEGGGIYEGPVGLVRAEDFTSFWKNSRQKQMKGYTMPFTTQKSKHLWCQQ